MHHGCKSTLLLDGRDHVSRREGEHPRGGGRVGRLNVLTMVTACAVGGLGECRRSRGRGYIHNDGGGDEEEGAKRRGERNRNKKFGRVRIEQNKMRHRKFET